MKIHEYQAKKILSDFGVDVQEGKVAFDAETARNIASELYSDCCVVKAQIHAGGRGKAGGVKLAKTSTEVHQIAKELLGKRLITHQTGPEGKIVQRILVAEAIDIEKEYYLGILIDRESAQPMIIASAEGGMDIEKVALEHPEKILKFLIDPLVGMQDNQCRRILFALGIPWEIGKKAIQTFKGLYNAFIAKDCSLVEINPLVLTKDKRLLALDAKMVLDDNGLIRHKELQDLRDVNEEDPAEREASKYNLNYIKLNGTIGCLVNGAGLAMTTMDVIKLYGAEPANFLDVGGSANVEQVRNAFKIILSDKNVRGIFVNIFGGIMKCDVIAEGIVQAAKEINVAVPLVVRLEGTNVEKGKEILEKSGLNIVQALSIKDGAEKIVKLI